MSLEILEKSDVDIEFTMWSKSSVYISSTYSSLQSYEISNIVAISH